MAGSEADDAGLLPWEGFRDPVLRALETTHRELGRKRGGAMRYRRRWLRLRRCESEQRR